jgi:hypothetical protein
MKTDGIGMRETGTTAKMAGRAGYHGNNPGAIKMAEAVNERILAARRIAELTKRATAALVRYEPTA